MSELKPCLLCGMYGVSYETRQETGNKLLACEFCGLRIEARTFDEAEEAWNHRSPDGALSRLLSAAREIRDIEREGGGSMDRVDEYRDRWEAAISALCEALEEVEA